MRFSNGINDDDEAFCLRPKNNVPIRSTYCTNVESRSSEGLYASTNDEKQRVLSDDGNTSKFKRKSFVKKSNRRENEVYLNDYLVLH
jgi:hypothetical protein